LYTVPFSTFAFSICEDNLGWVFATNEKEVLSVHETGVEARKLEAKSCTDAASEGKEAGAGLI